jgi:hypothetical protein
MAIDKTVSTENINTYKRVQDVIATQILFLIFYSITVLEFLIICN